MASTESPSVERRADREVRHVVVLGANGTMGYGGGALFTSAVPRVTFLARTREKAEQGLQAAIRAVRSPTVAARVQTGSYDDLERAVESADLVFEAVTEQLDLKRAFFARVDRARRPDAIVATVTSGLSIGALADGRSESFRRHFLGLHLFNPPNVIVGTELIAGRDTDPAIVDFVERFATRRLGRVIVRTADTPGFAGNRVGFKVLNEVAQLAAEHGPLLMDRLVGPYTGRALAPLATIDLVGWDIHRAIVDNVYDHCHDEAHATLKLPPYMARLMAESTLGAKSGRGFFKLDGKKLYVLVPKTGAYVPASEVKLPDLRFVDEVCQLHRVGRYREAMRAFAAAPGDEAALARRVLAGYVSYAYHRVGEVAADIEAIDRIMGFGFNWAPPSLLVDTIGRAETARMIEQAGLPVPRALAAEPEKRTHAIPNAGRFFVAG